MDDPAQGSGPSTGPEVPGPAAGPSPPTAGSPRWHPATKMVAGVAFGVAALGGVYLARNAITLVALSGLLAFLVAPLISLLQRHARFPKVLALLTSYAVVLVTVILLGGLIVAGIASSFSEVDPEEAAETLQETAIGGLRTVRTLEIGSYTLDLRELVDPAIERLAEEDQGGAAEDETIERRGTTFTVGGEQFDILLGSLVSSAQMVGGLLAAMVVTFLIAMYLSADSHRFHAGLLAQVPRAYADDAQQVNDRIGWVWRGYLYGQVVNSLATGFLVWVVLWAVGLPGAFVLGLIMALLNMIPTFGPILAAVPGVLGAIALGSTRLEWSTLSFTLLIIGIYIVVVQLQANVMAPFITGQYVRMSPAAILIGVIVGFQVGGLVGSLLAVPVLATFKEVARYVLAKLTDRDPFPGSREPDPST
jgi:predicted PurR-regulated permease PerM